MSGQIRRIKYPIAHKREREWFSKQFRTPQTKVGINLEAMRRFQRLIWEIPNDTILPTLGKCAY